MTAFQKNLGKGLKVLLALQISFTGKVKGRGRVLKIESFLYHSRIPLETELLWW